jgi:hypothetical protein
MRSVLIIAMLLVAKPAVAMNWEGHDDAFADDPYAKAFMQAAPHAKPLPSRACPVSEEQASANAYEQIPLTRHGCPEN